MRVYENESNPLVEVPLYELKDNTTYITDSGERVKFNERDSEFDIVQISELNQGEYVDKLTVKQLSLYWVLMKNKVK